MIHRTAALLGFIAMVSACSAGEKVEALTGLRQVRLEDAECMAEMRTGTGSYLLSLCEDTNHYGTTYPEEITSGYATDGGMGVDPYEDPPPEAFPLWVIHAWSKSMIDQSGRDSYADPHVVSGSTGTRIWLGIGDAYLRSNFSISNGRWVPMSSFLNSWAPGSNTWEQSMPGNCEEAAMEVDISSYHEARWRTVRVAAGQTASRKKCQPSQQWIAGPVAGESNCHYGDLYVEDSYGDVWFIRRIKICYYAAQ